MMSMDMPGKQTWIIFYLISFVVLLWAAFLTATGVMLWVSLLLVIIIVGINLMTVLGELKKHTARRELQRKLTEGFDRKTEEEQEFGPADRK
jgi:uncharacterized BrkB/YihY/UPF0761 family membrane protein